MPGLEHRRTLERRLADLESLLTVAETKARAEGEIGRAVVGRWARRAAAHARRVLAGFRREALLRDSRAGEPVSRRVRRFFSRDSPLLLRLKLCWELERALCRMDDLLGDDDVDTLHHEHGGVAPEHASPPLPPRREASSLVMSTHLEMPGGRDEAGKEAVVRALLDDQRDQHNVRVLLIVDAGTTTTTANGGLGKSSLAAMVLDDPRVRSHFEQMAWRRVPRELEAAAVVRSAIALAALQRRSAPEAWPGGALDDEAAGRRERSLLVVDGVWRDLGTSGATGRTS